MCNNQKGFLLIGIIFIMLLMVVTSISINYYAATQLRMAANQVASIRTGYEMKALVEQAVWKLTNTLFWRTSEAGEAVVFNNTPYTRIVRSRNTPPFTPGFNYTNYADAVTIQVIPQGATQKFQRSFRYYISKISGLSLNVPGKISMDSLGNLLIANSKNNRVIQVNPQTSAITVIAGTLTAGYNGDGSLGTLRQLNEPGSICTDATGTYYFIADTKNHRIREINIATNMIRTAAGTGSLGYSGDSGDATLAQVNFPQAVFWHSSNVLYIADTQNNRIRKVNRTTGIITTVAGTGSSGSTGDGGPAISATLKNPGGIFVDAPGNLYIADTGNYKVRKVTIATGIITTLAGTGLQGSTGDGGLAINARLRAVEDVFVNSNGTFFIADSLANCIRVVNAADGIIYTLAGTGTSGDTIDLPAVNAMLKNPTGITMKPAYGMGRIYICDQGNNAIKYLRLKPVKGL